MLDKSSGGDERSTKEGVKAGLQDSREVEGRSRQSKGLAAQKVVGDMHGHRLGDSTSPNLKPLSGGLATFTKGASAAQKGQVVCYEVFF